MANLTLLQAVNDGLRTALGKLNFGILLRAGTRVVLASEQAIAEAVPLIESDIDMRVELSAAVPIAAMLEHPGIAAGRVAVILSGGNVGD